MSLDNVGENMPLSKRTIAIMDSPEPMGPSVSMTTLPSTTLISPSVPNPHTLVLSEVHFSLPVLFTIVTLACLGGAANPGFTNMKLKASASLSFWTRPVTVKEAVHT